MCMPCIRGNCFFKEEKENQHWDSLFLDYFRRKLKQTPLKPKMGVLQYENETSLFYKVSLKFGEGTYSDLTHRQFLKPDIKWHSHLGPGSPFAFEDARYVFLALICCTNPVDFAWKEWHVSH